MDTSLVVTTVITVFLAFVGYLATYLNNLRLSQRLEKLERINRQLSELYGPLFALTHASDTAWTAFKSKRIGQGYFDGKRRTPTEEELKAWRLWMSTVFMPINLRIYEIILSKSDLLMRIRPVRSGSVMESDSCRKGGTSQLTGSVIEINWQDFSIGEGDEIGAN